MKREQTPEDLEQARQAVEGNQEKPIYTPRPKWQLILAWVLLGIVILGIVNIIHMQISA